MLTPEVPTLPTFCHTAENEHPPNSIIFHQQAVSSQVSATLSIYKIQISRKSAVRAVYDKIHRIPATSVRKNCRTASLRAFDFFSFLLLQWLKIFPAMFVR